MGVQRPDTEAKAQRASKQDQRQLVFVKAVLATAALAVLLTAGVFYTSGTPTFAASSGDDVSAADRKARIDAFNALLYLPLAKVDTKDIPAALDTMHLSQADRATIAAAIAHAGAPSPAKAAVAAATVSTVASTAKPSPSPAVAPAVAVSEVHPTLAWVRLWDTDVEDGDVVRIDSAGYSRTVTLTNRGLTFAVPVPAGGQIRITGVRDGDGGGITVGLASGAAQAVLPIMSVGQVLTLNVRTN
jgi:hypothetical protein